VSNAAHYDNSTRYIQTNVNDMQMERRFRAVNGILIPGGGQDLSPGHPYYDAVEYLFDLAVKENDAGVVYPVGGVYADLFYWHPVCCCPT